jgi:uncharacterized protein (DUF58 family)
MVRFSSVSKLSRLRRDGEAEAACFPALLAEAERVAATIAHGVHGRRESGSGEAFWQYRQYDAHDGAQSIDWRRSARDDHLYVRETERDASNAVYFWSDGNAGVRMESSTPHTKHDRAAVCLIAAASLLIRGGERVTALGAGRPRTGRVGLQHTSMALVDGDGSIEAVEAADISRFSKIVLASDFLDPPETWQARLASLTARGAQGVLLNIIAPEEEDFPFKGRTRFNTPTQSPSLVFGRAEDVRTAYRERWQQHQHDLETLARRFGFQLIRHRIDRPASTAVLALYQALAGEV